MKLKIGDYIIPKKEHRYNYTMKFKKHRITNIILCNDFDKGCPNECPGLISLDNKNERCYCFDNELCIQKISKSDVYIPFNVDVYKYIE